MAKWFYIEYKYSNEPWEVYERTQVEKMIEHYSSLVQKEFPGAEYRVRKTV